MKKFFVMTAYAEVKGGGGEKSGNQSDNQATTSFNNV